MSNLGSTIGMDPRSQKAGDFASKFLYDSEYDFAVKQAVRHQQSLEEVLEHSGIEKVWAQINPVRTETVDFPTHWSQWIQPVSKPAS